MVHSTRSVFCPAGNAQFESKRLFARGVDGDTHAPTPRVLGFLFQLDLAPVGQRGVERAGAKYVNPHAAFGAPVGKGIGLRDRPGNVRRAAVARNTES